MFPVQLDRVDNRQVGGCRCDGSLGFGNAKNEAKRRKRPRNAVNIITAQLHQAGMTHRRLGGWRSDGLLGLGDVEHDPKQIQGT